MPEQIHRSQAVCFQLLFNIQANAGRAVAW